MRIPLQYLRILPNITAGANPLVIMSLAYMMRSNNSDPPPIIVHRNSDTDYTIIDGRHRFIAAIIAGRPDILSELDTDSGHKLELTH